MSQTIDELIIHDSAGGEPGEMTEPVGKPRASRAGPSDRRRTRTTRRRVWAVTRIALFAAGLLALLFLAYFYSASFLTEARSQSVLLREFKASLLPSTPVNRQPPVGGPVGLLQIPSIGLQKVIVQGVTSDQTKRGPGHDPSTPLPGQVSNVVVIGRRATYGAPFKNLDLLSKGEQIVVFTSQGRFTYTVVASAVVPLGSTAVTAPTADNRITLISANPAYQWRNELVVVGLLSGKPLASATNIQQRFPGEKPGLTSWVSPLAPILLWSELFVFALVAAGILYRVWRPVPTYILTTPILITTLYLLFENVARLLPPSA